MFSFLLALHSLIRWLVLTSLIFSLYRAYSGWIRNKPFLKFDKILSYSTIAIALSQLVVGLSLYFMSPIVDYFIHHFKGAVHQRDLRFFGMEHSSTMLLAVILIIIGSVKAKGKTGDQKKFKTIAVWFTIVLIIILLSIPWPFSPFTSRPDFRPF